FEFQEAFVEEKENKNQQMEIGKVEHGFTYDAEDISIKNEQIMEFKERCDAIINLHFFYEKIFLKRLKGEKNNSSYALKNIERLTDIIYDEENA
ncbi:hypothetical protein, partial [Klebsiella pneumoniae]|uniref:hypothetical protein n=1 Tax=Klebsiella pneumoniae TaxID=573 RepID=UPI0025A1DBA3